MTDTWEEIKSFDDSLSAEALAAELRVEGVPAQVINHTHLAGLDDCVSVEVPTRLAHRARFVMKSLKPSEAELSFAATGRLGDKE